MKLVDKQERAQRIRVGLTGLAVVFLFVLLFTAIGRSGEEAGGPSPHNQLATPGEPSEPLAEIGAAPGAPASNEAAAGTANQAQ